MIIELVRDTKGSIIGWEMSGENPNEIAKLATIRNLQFFGFNETKIVYNGRRESTDNNPGILQWIQKQHVEPKLSIKVKEK